MSAPKAKAAASKKPNGKENGSAAPAPAVTKSNGDVAKDSAAAPATVGGSSRPDKAAYDAEQAKIKSEIDALQVKVVRTSLCGIICHILLYFDHELYLT